MYNMLKIVKLSMFCLLFLSLYICMLLLLLENYYEFYMYGKLLNCIYMTYSEYEVNIFLSPLALLQMTNSIFHYAVCQYEL